jgi:hypothetical protein
MYNIRRTYIQLLEAPRDTPYGRVLSGQTSATMIQAHGPQESICRVSVGRVDLLQEGLIQMGTHSQSE